MKINLKLIKEARIRKDYRQDDVAEILGISQSQYSKLENGEVSFNILQVGILLDKLDLNPFDIIEFSKNRIEGKLNRPIINPQN
ncbi:helix-turn-helix transcriptional regulator [Epilithonimonas sp.]|uniref:helix-turn-helix domain-containing protein n=1 Tax=Epilithonimonas sp. TaxID=2894511 RepID=UPI0028980060|nr:helix-turn-helix transcriptional regulator [Epilithonimonas sp.]